MLKNTVLGKSYFALAAAVKSPPVQRRVNPVIWFIQTLWLTGFCTLFIVLGFFFLWSDRGQDVLRQMIEATGFRFFLSAFFFFLGVLYWALATWYSARLLLTRQFSNYQNVFYAGSERLRILIPRIEGALIPLIVSLSFWNARTPENQGSWYFMIGLYIALSIGLLLLFKERRKMMREQNAAAVVGKLDNLSWIALGIYFGIAALLLILFLISPVVVPTLLGSAAIFMFAAASWVLFGSMVLTYLPMAFGKRSLTLPMIVLAVLFSWFNDNHVIRSIPAATDTAVREQPKDHFANWLRFQLDRHPEAQTYPVFVVASAGGGIRAAYWTASIMGRLADENPEWSDHLYALSGVSGGSVGLTVHAVQIADRLDRNSQGNSAKASPSFQESACASMKKDLLSPVVAYLLFPDLLQRLLPFPVQAADRARAIEAALEKAVAGKEGVGSSRMSGRFLDLWPSTGKERYRVPVLLLNTTRVETGQRAIISNLIVDQTFSDSEDLLDKKRDTQRMPLSTAAHLSARFTYVSPAGTVLNADGSAWGRIVDGGYFENSGAETALELIRGMRQTAYRIGKERKKRIPIMLILIRNDPDAWDLCTRRGEKEPEAAESMNELLSPVRAFLNTRAARGRLAEDHACDQIKQARMSQGIQESSCENGCYFDFSLRTEREDIDPPLGWSLSPTSCRCMDAQIKNHDKKFACIRQLIKEGRCDVAPECR